MPTKMRLSSPAANGIVLGTMKNRVGVIVLLLVLLCVGLGIVLIAMKKKATEELRDAAVTNTTLSNNVVQVNDQLDQQKLKNDELSKDREQRIKEFLALTNKYVESLAALAQVSNNLAQTEVALKTSQEETAKRDAKIAGLEAQNQALDKQAVDLSTAITNLTTQIEDTKRKLATSEGEKGFLEKELKRLMSEKAELERQFNDLSVLRAQVSKLKEELSIARRLEWIRQGLFASSDGSVKVIPPLTNRPAATNPPPK
jgi:chromosome segregation ATPase